MSSSGAPSSPPKFSILLPTYNQAYLLSLAIESVLVQSFEDFELLVVADGCTDGTQAMVRAIGDPRVRLFDLPKARGFGYANRNIALRQSQGELVAFLGHDNLYLFDHLELMQRPFEDPSIEFAHSRAIYVEANGQAWPWPVNLTSPSVFDDYLRGTPCDLPASIIVHRRSCLERYSYWPERKSRGGDWTLWRNFLENCGREAVAFVDAATALHFRAPWRVKSRAKSSKIERCYPSLSESWPISLPIPEGITEQSVYWEAIQADPVGWTAQFRRQCRAAMDETLLRDQQSRIKEAQQYCEERRAYKTWRKARRLKRERGRLRSLINLLSGKRATPDDAQEEPERGETRSPSHLRESKRKKKRKKRDASPKGGL